jgi:hypothetical protein
VEEGARAKQGKLLRQRGALDLRSPDSELSGRALLERRPDAVVWTRPPKARRLGTRHRSSPAGA